MPDPQVITWSLAGVAIIIGCVPAWKSFYDFYVIKKGGHEWERKLKSMEDGNLRDQAVELNNRARADARIEHLVSQINQMRMTQDQFFKWVQENSLQLTPIHEGITQSVISGGQRQAGT